MYVSNASVVIFVEVSRTGIILSLWIDGDKDPCLLLLFENSSKLLSPIKPKNGFLGFDGDW